jgi:hypothetical protein
MKKQNAFPTNQLADSDGMTLRDYFAAKAMQGLLAAQTGEWNIYDHYHELADESYRVADEMMIARNA